MAAKLAKYIALGLTGLAVISVIAVAIIDDNTIEAYGGGVGASIVSAKRGAIDGVGDVLNSVGGSVLSAFGGGPQGQNIPRVVQSMPPPPTPSAVAKPVETKTLAEIAAEAGKLSDATPSSSLIPSDPADINAGPTQITEQPQPATEALTQDMLSSATAPDADVTPTPTVADTPPPAPQMAGTPESMPTAPPETMAETMASLSASEPVKAEPEILDTALPAEVEAEPVSDIEAMLQEAAETEPEAAQSNEPDPTGEEAYAEAIKYYTGDGVERNFGTAAQYFIQAAERGHAGAQYNLGLMNYVGQTGGQDFANAAKWFEKAAESGHIQAQYNLGFLYYEGKGVQQDLKTAYDWIDRAAQQGYAKAVKARDALKKAMPEVFGS